MPVRRIHLRAAALLPALALAVYGVFGVFGHALHGLLPCGDEACQTAAVEAGCGCGHHAAVDDAVASSDGPGVRGEGHDASECSLCLLLAKIKVGRLAFYQAEFSIGHASFEPAAARLMLPADLVLSGVPRGPPVA